ncbi:hypothetical protein V2J09_014898 [Rumex salicifolius]
MTEHNLTSLAVEPATATGSGGGDHQSAKNMREAVDLFRQEIVKHWKLAAPIALTVLCNFMVYSITYIFVGHLGEVQLSAVAVSFTVIGTFTFGILDPEIAYLAGKFNMTVIPRMFSQATSFPAQKFLQAQSKMRPIALSGILGLAAHAALMWVCVTWLGWGLHGVAVAYNASYWCVACVQVGYVVFYCKDVWNGLSWEALNDFWGFVRLSLASGIMLCFELWNSMSMVLLAGHLHNAVITVGSLSICLNIDGYEMMLFVGMNAAVSIRVANELGLGHPKAAKYAIYVAAIQSVVIGLVAMLFVFLLRGYLGAVFTSDKELRHAVSRQAWLLGLNMILNGLWAGMLAGLVLQSSIILFMLYRTNWNQEVEQTAKRLQKWGREDINSENNAS